MAEMNGRMNGSQCVPPPALCIQFPSLQACTEGLPLMLQRPDNFPLVMGILQEINKEKVGFTGCAETEQRTLIVSEVKQESADIEEQHQSLNSDLCQEWSLKGVEELLIEPEDLQLRHDCSQLAHEPSVEHLGVCAVDEKPSIALQSVHPHYNWNGFKQAQLHVDEKPVIQLQITSSLEEQVLIQESALLHVDEKPKIKEVFPAACSPVDVDSESHLVVPVSTQVHVEEMHSMKTVKREPEEVEAQAPTYNKQAKSLEELKGSNDCLDVCQSVDNKASFRLNQGKKFSLSGQKSQSKRFQSSEPEREKRRLSMQNAQRNSNAVLALPADFSELEPSHSGKGNSQSLPSTSPSLEAEGSMHRLVSFKKDPVLAGDKKLQSVAEPDCCELTLGSAASKSQVANLGGPSSANCNEEKPAIKPLNGPKKHDDGQCQRTSPHQWQQARKRCVSRESHARQDAMPACTKKQLFPATDGSCGKDGENRLEHFCNFSLNMKKSRAQPQTVRATSNRKTESITCLDKEGCRQNLQPMPQNNIEGASTEKVDTQKLVSDDDGQMSEPNLPEAMESSQAELAPEPQKKKMRGTLPLDEKSDVFAMDKDTRCHRSDGKSWRCVRECINGAYYCQYHLRKRRIGYNRRKNNEVNPNDLEAVSKEALKSNKKSG